MNILTNEEMERRADELDVAVIDNNVSEKDTHVIFYGWCMNRIGWFMAFDDSGGYGAPEVLHLGDTMEDALRFISSMGE